MILIVDRDLDYASKLKSMLSADSPGAHDWVLSKGQAPWEELFDPNIEMIVLGTPAQVFDGNKLGTGVDTEMAIAWMESIRLGGRWNYNAINPKTGVETQKQRRFEPKTKRQLPILFVPHQKIKNYDMYPVDPKGGALSDSSGRFYRKYYMSLGANKVLKGNCTKEELTTAFNNIKIEVVETPANPDTV